MRNAFRFLWGEGLSVASKSDVVLRHAGGELAVGAHPGQPLTVLDVLSGFQEEPPRLYCVRQGLAEALVSEPVFVVDLGGKLRAWLVLSTLSTARCHAPRKGVP